MGMEVAGIKGFVLGSYNGIFGKEWEMALEISPALSYLETFIQQFIGAATLSFVVSIPFTYLLSIVGKNIPATGYFHSCHFVAWDKTLWYKQPTILIVIILIRLYGSVMELLAPLSLNNLIYLLSRQCRIEKLDN
jgi:hypothetical protein